MADEELKAEFLARKGATVCPVADKRPVMISPVREWMAIQFGNKCTSSRQDYNLEKMGTMKVQSWTEEEARAAGK